MLQYFSFITAATAAEHQSISLFGLYFITARQHRIITLQRRCSESKGLGRAWHGMAWHGIK
jgi:hypothetical protein